MRADELREPLRERLSAVSGPDVDAALALAADLTDLVPNPAGGDTAQRWTLLSELARRDLTTARIAEAHLDAVAILQEAGEADDLTGTTWGVFAAEGPGVALLATEPSSGSWRLDGVKPWCSLAGRLSHALVTARVGEQRQLFAVALQQPGVLVEPGAWHSRGLTDVPSGPVTFADVPARPVGEAGWYLTRPGFAHGGIGVAACWYGGAVGVAQALHRAATAREPDQIARWHLGAVDLELRAAELALDAAATQVDAGAADGEAGQLLAVRTRSTVAAAAERVLERVGHALGPAPLALDADHARRVADLTVYLRQHHAERDVAALGEQLAARRPLAVVTFRHTDEGTPEADWRTWLQARALPALDEATLLAPAGRLLVLAAHPDDETLGAGGLIAMAAERGLDVDVVVATAGEGSHPQSRTLPGDLARLRSREVVRAVAELAPTASVHLLDLPDGELAECTASLRDQLGRLAARTASARGRAVTVLAAPWRSDAHPDHEAAGAAAAELAGALGVPLLEYPIWAWHWAGAGDDRLPWAAAASLSLPAKALRHKRSAMACHVSQTTPLSAEPGDEALLSAQVLAHFERAAEVFFVSDPSASLPAGYFEDFYADGGTDPWGFETRWYERRKRDLTLASLPRERFRRAFEPGCSIGVLTVELAARCDEVLAMDVATTALERTRSRTRDLPGVRVERGAVPGDWPTGTFDLILLSEVAYYCAGADLADLVRRAGDSLTADGVLVACHWRHRVDDYPVSGDLVHERLREHPRLRLLASHQEEDFLLDVLVPAETLSVARQAGLTD